MKTNMKPDASPKAIMAITLIVMLGLLFGAVGWLANRQERQQISKPVVNCAEKGEIPFEKKCCEGLISKAESNQDETGECIHSEKYTSCMACGDGICEGPPMNENKCNCPEDCKEKQEVTIATDKIEYKQGETVKITLSRSDKPIYVEFGGVGEARYVFYQLKGAKWERLATGCETNCVMVCENGVLKQGPCALYEQPQYNFNEYKGSWEGIQWNQKECIYENKLCGGKNYSEGSLKQASAGKFKVEFCYFDKEDVDMSEPPGYAPPDKEKCVEKEFTIKEKSAIDPRCGQKVEFDRMCAPGSPFRGYEFDSGEGKCIERQEVACPPTSKTPFNSLEECQKVCEKPQIDFYSCSQDSDCIKVKNDCCGCNAGGSATAINKNFKTQWKGNCNEIGIACPAVMSNDPSCFAEPKCENNKCVLAGKK